MQRDLCHAIDWNLKRLLTASISAGQIRADQINVDRLLEKVYKSFDDESITRMLRDNSVAQKRRARMLGIVHRWNICHGDETVLALLRQYLTEHRHARILSGICEYKSPSDAALANFIEASTSKNLLTFLHIAEEPDLQELEDMLSHVI